MVALRHIPPLLIASAFTFGGFWPLFDAPAAINEFGLPEHVALSKPAQSVMMISSARISAIGMAIWAFYFQRKYAAIDTILVTILWIGVVDCYVCWIEGVSGRGIFRASCAAVVGGWGLLGMTAGRG